MGIFISLYICRTKENSYLAQRIFQCCLDPLLYVQRCSIIKRCSFSNHFIAMSGNSLFLTPSNTRVLNTESHNFKTLFLTDV